MRIQALVDDFTRPLRLALMVALPALIVACDSDSSPTDTTPQPSQVEDISPTGSNGSLNVTAGSSAELAIRVTDASGNAVAGLTTDWAVTSGEGGLTPMGAQPSSAPASVPSAPVFQSVGSQSTQVVTNQNGEARVSWHAGGSVGSSEVTASAQGETLQTFSIQVQPGDVASVTADPSALEFHAVGEEAGVSAEAHDQHGNLLQGTFQWSSLNEDVVTIAGGVATAVGAGSSALVVSMGTAADTVPVTVTQSTESIEITPTEAEIEGINTVVAFEATAYDANGHEIPLSPQDFDWSTGNSVIATVRPNGRVTARAAGETTVQASREGHSAEATLLVIQIEEPEPQDPQVIFADASVEAAVRAAIGIPEDPIFQSDLEGLTSLTVSNAGVTDLGGLEHALDLEHLQVNDNDITDLSPVAGLEALTFLGIWNNSNLSDLSPVANLTQLEVLAANEVQVQDVGPLQNLTQLESINLRNSQVQEIGALVANAGLGTGDYVDLQGNPLSQTALCDDIPELQGRGVTVEFDGTCDPNGDEVSFPDANLEAAVRAAISKPTGPILESDLEGITSFAASNQGIANLTGMQYFVDLVELQIDNNDVTDLSPLSSLTGLTELRIWNNSNLSDLSPLASLTQLQLLAANNVQVQDVGPLQNLTQLEEILLRNSQIEEIGALVANTGLGTGDYIDLRDNPLSSTAICDDIPELINRGVNVEFDGSCL